jgi:hypothetical protein
VGDETFFSECVALQKMPRRLSSSAMLQIRNLQGKSGKVAVPEDGLVPSIKGILGRIDRKKTWGGMLHNV